MIAAEASNKTSVLADLGVLLSTLQSGLLQRAVVLTTIPFLLTLLLNIAALLFIGVPEGPLRLTLPSLFDPLYQTFVLTLALTAWHMRSFFRALPYTFQRLAEQGVIAEKDVGSAQAFVQDYQRRLYRPARQVIAIVSILIGLALNYFILFKQDLYRLLPGHEPDSLRPYTTVTWLSNWINGLGILIVIVVAGLLIFRLFVTARLINRAPSFFDFHIQLSHPDQCGGFKAVGDLCLKMVYILLVPTVFVSFWLVVSKHVTLTPEWQTLVPGYVLDPAFRNPIKVLLVLLAVSGMGIFFWPMYSIHTLMVAERVELQKTLDTIARRIHELDSGILSDPTSMLVDERKKKMDEIESLKELYLRTSKAPAWPIDRKLAINFATTQIIPMISLLGLGGPIQQLFEIVTKLFQE